MINKEIIYYPRTYRHLRHYPVFNFLYFLVISGPALYILFKESETITKYIAGVIEYFIGNTFSDSFKVCNYSEGFPGKVVYAAIDVPKPGHNFVFWNIVFVLVLMVLLLNIKKIKGHPLMIFSMVSLITHLCVCAFVFLGFDIPYDGKSFSLLYLRQQFGIWVAFIILYGAITGILEKKCIPTRILGFLLLVLYSAIFGIIRYIVFLYILGRFSILYIGVMYFILGPIFDFVYFTWIYSLILDHIIGIYSKGSGKDRWVW